MVNRMSVESNLSLSELVTQLLFRFCGRAFAKDLPWARALDRLSVHLLPLRKLTEKSNFIAVWLAMARKWNA